MTRIISDDVLFVTLDSCRYDTFLKALSSGKIPNLGSVGPLHRAHSPSYYTYGSHSSFWMGFTPGVIGSSSPFLNPKAGKIFRMQFAGHSSNKDCYSLHGSNIIEGFRNLGFKTIGTGSVDWFNPSSETGAILGQPFDSFYFSGNTWSLRSQISWLHQQISDTPDHQNRFVFLNIGETHVPYWYEGASWKQRPSPCIAFGGSQCDAEQSAFRQLSCLEWVDSQLCQLINSFLGSTILICSDHGDCWGEDGLWEHGISHPMTLTVPLLLRLRGQSV